MRILIVNDDGIQSKGICRLASLTGELGEVWVVAPHSQCSAMSHKISVFGTMEVIRETEFPVEGVTAYSLTGSPADCVKVGLDYLLPWKPDLVFSGINHGFNVGYDILYSGTVGAAMEALVNGIPAMAFSNDTNEDCRVSDRYLIPIVKSLLKKDIAPHAIWNVNFPAGDPEKVRGILEDRFTASMSAYRTLYHAGKEQEGRVELEIGNERQKGPEEGSDMAAVFAGYISVGKVESAVLRNRSSLK